MRYKTDSTGALRSYLGNPHVHAGCGPADHRRSRLIHRNHDDRWALSASAATSLPGCAMIFWRPPGSMREAAQGCANSHFFSRFLGALFFIR